MKKHNIKERQYKICRLSLRLTEAERDKIQALANRLTSGNVSKLIVSALTDRPIPVVEVNEADQRVVDHLKKIMDVYRNIGINYNQVVKYINAIRPGEDVKAELLALTDKTEKLNKLTSGLNVFLNELSNGNKNQ